MSYATASDVADRLGRDLTPSENRMVWPLLDDATALIDSQVSGPSAVVACAICAAMVLRVLRNPEGRQQLRIDDLSVTHAAEAASGLLRLLPHELKALQATASHAAGEAEAFGITPVPSADVTYGVVPALPPPGIYWPVVW